MPIVWGFFGPMPPKKEPEKTTEPDTEPDLSEQVRTFFNLGFDEIEAIGLAWEGVSPSQARELLKKGCSHKTAAQILL